MIGNKSYWRHGTYYTADQQGVRKTTYLLGPDSNPKEVVVREIIRDAHRLRSRYMARKFRKWGRAFLVLPVLMLGALARYSRAVAQPWRMNGDRIAHGNRR